MADDYSPLAQDVEKKFQDWFGDPVSAEASLPAEVDHSIGSPVLADPPHTADTNHIKRRTHRTRKRQSAYSTNLPGMLIFGFIGAVSSAVGVALFFYNLNSVGLYSGNWSGKPYAYIFATIFGLILGLFIFYIIEKNEK